MSAADGWRGQLWLDHRGDAGRTVVHSRHEGPLRVLQPLYPEGPGICHNVLVHPPGGVVAGDELHVHCTLAAGAHALVTTPGATRFYRSEGATALQHAELALAAGARLEWLPLEAIAYSGCRAANTLRAVLQPGAEMIGWDVLALGLPASGQGFDSGWFEQRIEVPGVWLERGRIAAGDTLLRTSPLGLAGHSVLATAWFAAGQALPAARRAVMVDAARDVIDAHAASPPSAPPLLSAGVSALQPSVVVLRVLASRVEPVMQLLAGVRAAWRAAAWQMAAPPPRVWAT